MQTKLTLRMEEELIARAKAFARRSGRSVSQIVADYFALLDAELRDQDEADTPIVSSIRGSLSNVDVDLLDVPPRRRGRGR